MTYFTVKLDDSFRGRAKTRGVREEEEEELRERPRLEKRGRERERRRTKRKGERVNEWGRTRRARGEEEK